VLLCDEFPPRSPTPRRLRVSVALTKLFVMNAETRSALTLAYLVDVLRFSLSALDLADAPSTTTLRQIKELEAACGQLELLTVRLLTASGTSWQEMADQLGVARQSLHRRLARKSVATLRVESTSGPGLRAEWQTLINRLIDKADELQGIGPSRSVV
jgi:hypothetical protein